eukprot:1161625-Pelagomonas_calceolata.AAC.30
MRVMIIFSCSHTLLIQACAAADGQTLLDPVVRSSAHHTHNTFCVTLLASHHTSINTHICKRRPFVALQVHIQCRSPQPLLCHPHGNTHTHINTHIHTHTQIDQHLQAANNSHGASALATPYAVSPSQHFIIHTPTPTAAGGKRYPVQVPHKFHHTQPAANGRQCLVQVQCCSPVCDAHGTSSHSYTHIMLQAASGTQCKCSAAAPPLSASPSTDAPQWRSPHARWLVAHSSCRCVSASNLLALKCTCVSAGLKMLLH